MADKTRIVGNLVSDNNLFVNTTTDNTGIGTTNPTSKLHVVGNALFTGIVTATTFVGNLTGGTADTATNVIGGIGSLTSLQVSGVSTLGIVTASNVFSTGIVTATQFSTGSSGIGINTNTISGPAILIIDPAAVGDNTGAVRIKGDFYVDGTQTVINSTTLEVADLQIGIGTTAINDVILDGAGIGIGSLPTRKTFTWEYSTSSFKSSENINLALNKTYKINGTDVLSSTTLGSGVTNSSLTSVGTLGNLNVSGISTLGTVKISSGIITATSGIVTYYGDGYNLSRTKQSYQYNNSLVGSGTTLNFIGAGVSSVTLLNDIVTVNIPNTVRTINTYTATEGQTVFSATYNLGLVDVYLNGSKLSQTDYSATDGLTVVLTEGASLNDLIEIVGYVTYKVVGTQTILVDTVTGSSGIITSYTGIADQGSSQSASVWTIRRSIFTAVGITSSTSSAVNVPWINRLTVTYT